MKKILFIILTAILALSVQAQTLRTSYFMDKYTNRHQRNPALTPAWGYINFPALGNIHLDILQTNMKLSDYIYPAANKDNGTVLFLHEDVNSEEFLKKIRKNGESFGFDANINILGFGFFTKNDRFWSFDLNVRAYGGVNIPKDFFAMLKKMDFGVGETYNFKNLNASVRAYTELALGHSRNINEDLRVGGKLKFLMGIADARAMIDDFSIHTTPDVWTINARGTATYLGVEGLGFQTDSTGAIDWKETLKPNSNDIKYVPRGYGAAIDLGVAYNLDKLFGGFLKGFTASFGLTDLGFIRYSNSSQAQAGGKVIHGSDMTIIRYKDDSLRIDFDHLTDQLEKMIEFRPTSATEGMTRGLRTATNLGLEYSFSQNKMSAGLLWSTYFGLPRTFSELTLSYNLRPVNWFSLSLSSSVAHGFFRSAGWAMNITPKHGLNLFIGMDYIPFAWTPKLDKLDFGLPIYTANVNFNFGLSIPLGGNRHSNYPRSRKIVKDVDVDVKDVNIDDLPLEETE